MSETTGFNIVGGSNISVVKESNVFCSFSFQHLASRTGDTIAVNSISLRYTESGASGARHYYFQSSFVYRINEDSRAFRQCIKIMDGATEVVGLNPLCRLEENQDGSFTFYGLNVVDDLDGKTFNALTDASWNGEPLSGAPSYQDLSTTSELITWRRIV